MGKNNGKTISKSSSDKYGQKLLDHAKRSATDSVKTLLKRGTQKKAEATGDLIGNKIDDKITRVAKASPKNSSDANEEEIKKEKYIYPELRQTIIDDLRLI